MCAAGRHPTRRGFITVSASLVAASALSATGSASAHQLDRDLIDLLYQQKRTQIAHYEAILQAFDDAAFADAGLPENSRDTVETLLAAEKAHLAAVTRPDGPRAASVSAVMRDNLRDALREATDLENLAVASYAFVIAELDRQKLIPELLGIHSVEARHASWLATLLGEEPFPTAIDAPLTLEESTSGRDEGRDESPVMATPVDAAAIEPIVTAIARELAVSPGEIDVISVTPQIWPDSSLGCPQPDTLYAQVVTPGYQVTVEVAGEQITFHTDERGIVVRCP
ncbi:MAG: ferritin-like domain-containing protein [Thermomicrobiales bacterium]